MNKKIVIILSIVIVITVIVGTIILIQNNQTKPEDILNNYISLINNKNYEEMYEQITESSKREISKEDFIKRNKNIYDGIDCCNIKIDIKEKTKEDGIIKISYTETMSTSAGMVSLENTTKLQKQDKTYKIEWSSSQIFPQLRDSDKVRVNTLKASRGEILDRNGNKLAENGKISTVGIVPNKLGENDEVKEKNISEISELTGVSTEYIKTQLSASYVKENTFVPIKKVAMSNSTLKDKLLQISGVMITSTDARVYPYGKEAAHLTGYVQTISAEILEERAGKGYNSNSIIGKSGLEYAYEDEIRGIDGVEIYIEDENGTRVRDIAKQDKKDGKDIKLTIDCDLQEKFYNQLKDDKGFFVVMEPKTGEILALVSTPTYDANDFVLGLTNDEWNKLNNDESKPLYTRYLQSYCPGSTFKAVTAGIALTTSTIDINTILDYNGLSWQKDSSWGNYNVTTLTSYSGNKNVTNALIHSDNIFFAQATLKTGKEKYIENLKKLGFGEDFGEKIGFPLRLKTSQFSNRNGTIDTEIKLADTGYGQGDLLVNPILMASIYSAFANDGKMVKPYLEYKGEIQYINKSAFSSEAANIVKDALIQVVESPTGTANDMRIQGMTIAGKTGTAELKVSSEDSKSGTLGWFNCFTTNRQQGNLLIIGMVENVQNNSEGGSHYIIKKIKEVL